MLASNLLRGSLTTALLFLSAFIFAQNRTITGKVTDSKDGTPVVGASVVPKGTNRGTTTDASGNFSISLPANVSTIVVSSVGFGQQEVAIGDGNSVDVKLETTGQDLNAVVVVGYGTVRKKDLTGSVAS